MLTREPTEQMIAEWKRVFKENRGKLSPDRKTGAEVDKYFRRKYAPLPYADEEFLQRVVRRKLGLPWEICRTGRLIIREFAESDADSIPPGETGGPGDGIFQDREKLRAYIGQQYGFCQYGIWAVTDKESGRLVGMAGFGPPAGDMDGLELGYHIFAPWRRRGYGLESCRAVLEWERRELGLPVWARIHRDNTPSLRLAGWLGFQVFREEKEILYLIQNKKAI